MATCEVSGVIVWEWFNEYGRWRPYEARVVKLIEENKHETRLFSLGNADSALSSYLIDAINLQQIRQETGTSRPIRRTVYPSSNPAASGILWQWTADIQGMWQSYDLDTAMFVEQAYSAKDTHLNLARTATHLPYTIDFTAMTQTRNDSGFKRHVRRFIAPDSYPVDKSSKHYSSHSSAAKLHDKKKFMKFSPTSSTVSSSSRSPAEPSTSTLPVSRTHASANTGGSVEEVLRKYVTKLDMPPDEDCCICCDKLSSESGYDTTHGVGVVLRLDGCSHTFHGSCLQAMYESGPKNGHIQCPTCKTIYGEKMGNSPKGSMECRTIPHTLPGYEDCKTILIVYNFKPGVQGQGHPHPGKKYKASGFPRACYLPDNERGRKVLKLLKVAWDRRLTFTISTSATTGMTDTVTWNEIHHKTEFGTNQSGHGYPDPNYLDNVIMELEMHGVTEEDLK